MYDLSTDPTPSAAASTTLADFAKRARGNLYFLACPLAKHRERFGLTPDEQRKHLGVKLREWPLFQLCRSPEVDRERWEEVLGEICTRFGCDRERLGRALRAGE
jgi:hypothetical protein